MRQHLAHVGRRRQRRWRQSALRSGEDGRERGGDGDGRRRRRAARGSRGLGARGHRWVCRPSRNSPRRCTKSTFSCSQRCASCACASAALPSFLRRRTSPAPLTPQRCRDHVGPLQPRVDLQPPLPGGGGGRSRALDGGRRRRGGRGGRRRRAASGSCRGGGGATARRRAGRRRSVGGGGAAPSEAAPSVGGGAARAAGRGRQAHDVGAREDPAHARGAPVGVEGGERAPDGGAAPRGEGGPVAAAREGLRVRPRAAEDGAADGRVDAPPRRLARRRARAAPPAPAAAVGAGGARPRATSRT